MILYGTQTKLAINNFPISGLHLPKEFIQALAAIKLAAAMSNQKLKLIPAKTARAIIKAAELILIGKHLDAFPIDIFQTGSATSTNMNMNEVLANLAMRIGKFPKNKPIHPNNIVNKCQSSNDVIPSTMHVSAVIKIKQELIPSLMTAEKIIKNKAISLKNITKIGRTHLMDALPITFAQELSAWRTQISQHIKRLKFTLLDLQQLTLGGTAVGTGVNAHPKFAKLTLQYLSKILKLKFTQRKNLFEGQSTIDPIIALSGNLNSIATSLIKISNDLRLMNSGPLYGFNEISLPALQAGSSIMPGKVNPVIPEAVMMTAAQVIGYHTSITLAGTHGNFELNTMLPMVAYNILQSITILSNAIKLLAEKAIDGFKINQAAILAQKHNPLLLTALTPILGYDKVHEMTKAAYKHKNLSLVDIAHAVSALPKKQLAKLLDPKKLTKN